MSAVQKTTTKRNPVLALTWAAVAVLLVAVLVIVTLTITKKTPTASNASTLASSTVMNEINHIPASVYNTVGISSPLTAVVPPTAFTGLPKITSAGKPELLYIGANFCPYCAAERWALVSALSRFGTFSNLHLISSAPSPEVYPQTPTLSFYQSSYTSPYLSFVPEEIQTVDHKPLQKLSIAQNALLSKFDTYKYLPANGAGGSGSIPFLDFGGLFMQAGSSYSPAILHGLTQTDITSALAAPSSPITQTIIATANQLTADICKMTGGKPGSVCQSSGVLAAAKSQKISF